MTHARYLILCAAAAAVIGCGKRIATEPAPAESSGTNLVETCLSKVGASVPNILTANGDKTRQKTLDDFAGVLNAQTWDEFDDIRNDGLYSKLEIITDIHLPGIDDPLLFIKMRNQGSLRGTTIFILRRDAASGKWRNIHHLEEGDGSDLELFPVDMGGHTRFLNAEVAFESKLLSEYSVLDYKPEADEWSVAGKIGVSHSFQLSAEDKKWIANEQVSELVLGKRVFDSGNIPLGNKTLELEKFSTSNGLLPDGYYVKVVEAGKTIWPEKEQQPLLVRGFLPVERDGKYFVVFLDYAKCETGMGIKISVLDIQELTIVHEHVAPVISSFESTPTN